VQNINYMFNSCTNLTSLPSFDVSNVSSEINGFFGNSTLEKLTDFGGLVGYKGSRIGNFKNLPNLTYQSCINVLNGLYDFTGNNQTPSSSQGKLKVHANFLTTVGDEISIGTNKGWTITA
jgi:surface protein